MATSESAGMSRSDSPTPRRYFRPEWEKQFLCKVVGNSIQCLICKQYLALKKFNMQRHYELKHQAAYGDIDEEGRDALVKRLKVDTFNENRETCSADVVRASFELAHMIVARHRPYRDGEFVKDCLLTAARNVCPSEVPRLMSISLSRNSVASRAQELAGDLERQLIKECGNFMWFSLALDESTDISDTAQMAVYIRGINRQLQVTEEFLELLPMSGTTKGQDIFDIVVKCVDSKGLCWDRLVSVATDGAAAMVGEKKGLIGRLKLKFRELNIQEFIPVHCLLHQEVLCAKSTNLKKVMDTVIHVTNYIRAHALHHRQFKGFLESLHSEHTDIPYHCDVRWLSRGKVLHRFFELREVICMFLKEKHKAVIELEDSQWVADLAFLTDLTGHLNILNLKLQGKNKLIVEMWDLICSFKRMLVLWTEQLRAGNLLHFPSLVSLQGIETAQLQRYTEHLQNLTIEFNNRFADVAKLETQFSAFDTPFTCNIDKVNDAAIQLELIELQCDRRLKEKFDNSSSDALIEFYRKLDNTRFPNLISNAAKTITMFGSTYVCEQGFSIMKLLKTRHRNRLSDSNLASSLRICLSNVIQPNFEQCVNSKICQVTDPSNV